MESECFLICKDYWEKGFNKIFINPNVKVAYEYWDYYREKYVDPFYKYNTYLYYYVHYFFDDNPSSGDLAHNDIAMKKDWRFYI